MRSMRLSILAAVTAFLCCFGCSGDYESEYEVIVGNLGPDPIKAFVNGQELGDVIAARTRSFFVRLRQSGYVTADANNNPISPVPSVAVTFGARDLSVGFAYPGVSGTISLNAPTYVEFKLDCPEDITKRCTASSKIVPR
jgi:hypothetical protein